MTILTSDAARIAYLVHIAQDMFDSDRVKPQPDPRIAKAGWELVAHVRGAEPSLAIGAALKLTEQQVFFGFLARSATDRSRYAVAIRGTGDTVEWFIDALFPLVDYAPSPGAKVEAGFFGLYETLKFYQTDGTEVGRNLVEGILKTIGTAAIVVTGHSLGAAMATYLGLDLANAHRGRVQVALFASPRPGNAAFGAHYAAKVADSTIYNYALDIVPHAPPSAAGYETLPGAKSIGLDDSEADIRPDIACHHYVIDYIAMLDYPYFKSIEPDEPDADKKTAAYCIVGPSAFGASPHAIASVDFLTDHLLEGKDAVKSFAAKFPALARRI